MKIPPLTGPFSKRLRKHLELIADAVNALTEGAAMPEALPVAEPTGVTVDTTTYDNPVTGDGKIATLVFPQDAAVFAVAIQGDAYPRIIVSADPNNLGLGFGDGTVEPGDACVALGGDGGLILGGGPYGTIQTRVPIFAASGLILPDVPTTDPHAAGSVWDDGGTLKRSQG